MKIYTRTSDRGRTRLIDGTEVFKHSDRIKAYGTIDELNSFIGLTVSESTGPYEIAEELRYIQRLLFDCGADLATPKSIRTANEGRIKQCDVEWLEEKIDYYTQLLPPLKSFVLPGGSKAASYLHVARTIARRGEREVVEVLENEIVPPHVLPFINRLSDYLFTMARYMNIVDGVEEHQYKT